MNNASPEINRVIEALDKYADLVRRICFIYMKNQADVEDIFQEVFLKLLQYKEEFESEEHKKAWLCRVTINKCKDYHKDYFRKNVSSFDEVELIFEDPVENEIMQEVLALPKKYKDVVYLFYYEGYTVSEISKILKTKVNTIYSHLNRARTILKYKLEEQ